MENTARNLRNNRVKKYRGNKSFTGLEGKQLWKVVKANANYA